MDVIRMGRIAKVAIRDKVLDRRHNPNEAHLFSVDLVLPVVLALYSFSQQKVSKIGEQCRLFSPFHAHP